jgi:hypothetical protein
VSDYTTRRHDANDWLEAMAREPRSEDYRDLGWDEGNDCPPPTYAGPSDPAYYCATCGWEGDEAPIGPLGFLVCRDCGAPIDDFPVHHGVNDPAEDLALTLAMRELDGVEGRRR